MSVVPSCLNFPAWFKDQTGWKVRSLVLEKKYFSLTSREGHVIEISHIFGFRDKTWEVLFSDCCDTYITTSELKEIASISGNPEVMEAVEELLNN